MIGEKEFYCIAHIEKIRKNNIDAHIKRFESLEECCEYPGATFHVIKEQLRSESIPGNGTVYPNVFRYKIVDSNLKQYFIQYENCKSVDSSIVTRRLDYYYSDGEAGITIIDRNGELQTHYFGTDFDHGIGVIKNLVEFLIEFEENYSSDWKHFRIKSELDEKVKSLEQEVSRLKLKLSDANRKIKKYKARQKEGSVNKNTI